jgi:NDP-sugar pyrophosphorylase family protein
MLVVGSGNSIGEGVLLEDSIIWQRVTIEEVATVKCSVIADGCYLGTGSSVTNSVLADNVSLAPGHQLPPDSKIMPGTGLG